MQKSLVGDQRRLSLVERDGKKKEREDWERFWEKDRKQHIERGWDRGKEGEKVRDSRMKIAGPVLSKAK